MYFESFAAALAMDGHGVYVWSAYAISVVVLAYLIWSPLRRRKVIEKQLRGEFRRAQLHAESAGE